MATSTPPAMDSTRQFSCRPGKPLPRLCFLSKFPEMIPFYGTGILRPDDVEFTRLEEGKAVAAGTDLVVPRNWRSPKICLHTGATKDLGRMRRKRLIWIHPLGLTLFLVAISVGTLTSMMVFLVIAWTLKNPRLIKKTTVFHYLSLQEEERIKRQVRLNLWMLGAGSILTATSSLIPQPSILLVPGFLVIFASLVLLTLASRLFGAKMIHGGAAWIWGIPADVRRSILELEGSPQYPPEALRLIPKNLDGSFSVNIGWPVG